MAFENIEIQHGNFALDRTGAAFYTMNHLTQTLIKKDNSGNLIFSFIVEDSFIEVQSLQFDGYFYWTLEKQGLAGFRVSKWEIGEDSVLRRVVQHAFATDVINKYDVNAMAVEHYFDTLDNLEVVGTTTFDVVDGQIIQVGDRIVIGPSTAVGFEGEFFTANVIGKVGDTTITVSPPLGVTFSPNDVVVFTRSFFVFSDTAPGNQRGALYRFRYDDAFPLSLDVTKMFDNIRGSTFFGGKLLFVKGGEIIHLNADSLTIFRSQAIDNLQANRSEYHTTFDLAGFSNIIYRLEQQKTFFNVGFNQWQTENWAPLFNYNISSLVPEIYFIAVKAEPPILHRFVSSIPVSDLQSKITVVVLDQFRTPVFNRIVNLSSTGGPLSSIQETTNENGEVTVIYTASSSLGEVTITANVP